MPFQKRMRSATRRQHQWKGQNLLFNFVYIRLSIISQCLSSKVQSVLRLWMDFDDLLRSLPWFYKMLKIYWLLNVSAEVIQPYELSLMN